VTERHLLDTGPLGRIAYPRKNSEAGRWLERLRGRDIELMIPEIADYELRRELIRADLKKSLARLNWLKTELPYIPLDTDTMMRAAEFWAQARNMGKPVADPKELDGDVILAAQAERAGAVVLTDNIAHLGLFVRAMDWHEFLSEP